MKRVSTKLPHNAMYLFCIATLIIPEYVLNGKMKVFNQERFITEISSFVIVSVLGKIKLYMYGYMFCASSS